MTNYYLEKSIWTEKDFEQMGWHDSFIYAFTLGKNFEFILDIDYIFNWVHPIGKEEYFKFWVAPCTLIFGNTHDLKFDIEVSEPFELEILDIHRNDPQKPKNAEFINCDIEYTWTIELRNGEITFKSIGFKQYVRQIPVLLDSQTIEIDNRKSISFERNELPLK